MVRCVLVLRCGLAGVVWYPYAGWSTASACIRIPALTFETCWAVNSEIIKQVTSSWAIFIQLTKPSSSSWRRVVWQICTGISEELPGCISTVDHDCIRKFLQSLSTLLYQTTRHPSKKTVPAMTISYLTHNKIFPLLSKNNIHFPYRSPKFIFGCPEYADRSAHKYRKTNVRDSSACSVSGAR